MAALTFLVDANVLSEEATALTHGLVVATRNRRDFEKAGVEIVDPFGST
jgi:hypothetical protein